MTIDAARAHRMANTAQVHNASYEALLGIGVEAGAVCHDLAHDLVELYEVAEKYRMTIDALVQSVASNNRTEILRALRYVVGYLADEAADHQVSFGGQAGARETVVA